MGSDLRKITEANIKHKNVLVGVDYNVPMKNGKITSTERIDASLKTIKYLLGQGAAVILCSHFGRPGGKVNDEFSLAPAAACLEDLLGTRVRFVRDCVGPIRDRAVKEIKTGEVILLENLRFYAGEEKNDPKFAEELSRDCDLFINDAFSNSHRDHASVVGVTKFLPSYAGFAVMEEIEGLKMLIENPKRPFVMISGGAKVSEKIDVLKNMVEKIDVLIIGGGMANTFLAAEGYEVGKSLFEEDHESSADELSRLAEEKGVELILPDDVVCANAISENARSTEKSIDEVEKSDIIVDIGSKTVAKCAEPLKFAGTIFWNGPVGISEYRDFAKSTMALAKIVSTSDAKSVIGGGDTVAVVSGLDLKFDFISSGGGASLEYVSGVNLPGLVVLEGND